MKSTVEEGEIMESLKLYSPEESKKISKRRNALEYKISNFKDLKTFETFIQFEKIVLRDISERRKKLNIFEQKDMLEAKIIARIKQLYDVAIKTFPSNYQLCRSFFKFCKDTTNHQSATHIIEHMLLYFPHIPETWQFAAKWYFNQDAIKAFSIIQNGAALHKGNKSLYLEAIKMELLNHSTDDSLTNRKIQIYIDNVYKHIVDFNFLLELLTLLSPHKYTKSVQDNLVKYLLEHHSNEESVWHTLAQREKEGHHYQSYGEVHSKNVHCCLLRCAQKYEEGIAKISTERKVSLWQLYLDNLLSEIQVKSGKVFENNLKKKLALQAFEKAEKSINLQERYYMEWSRLVEDDENSFIDIIDKGLTALPTSVELWMSRLRYAIVKSRSNEFNVIFKRGIMELKEKCAPLWLEALRYYSLNGQEQEVEMVYQTGLNQPPFISSVLKPQYLEWVIFQKGILGARKVYNLLANQEPHCKQLHLDMIKYEEIELAIGSNTSYLKQIHRLACDQFKHDVDVWILFLEFYFKYSEILTNTSPDFNLESTVQSLLEEAENSLKDDKFLVMELKDRFSQIKNLYRRDQNRDHCVE